jgi:hypothetical protein
MGEGYGDLAALPPSRRWVRVTAAENDLLRCHPHQLRLSGKAAKASYGNYIFDKTRGDSGYKVGQAGAKEQVEVTPEMVSAGAYVLSLYRAYPDETPDVELAEEVYTAMRQARDRGGNRPGRP